MIIFQKVKRPRGLKIVLTPYSCTFCPLLRKPVGEPKVRREEARNVLDKLSDCVQLRLGVEAFIEPPGTWGYNEKTEGYKLIIRDEAINPSNDDCIESLAEVLGLKTRWVWRLEESFLMIYTPVRIQRIA